MAVRETAERLMDVAEAHMRSARYGGFGFRDLAAKIDIKSVSIHCLTPFTERSAFHRFEHEQAI
jgi:hypothetical protein